jgi:hypothetical protein
MSHTLGCTDPKATRTVASQGLRALISKSNSLCSVEALQRIVRGAA